MTKSKDDQFLGEVVTVTQSGQVIGICKTSTKPSKRKYPTLIAALKRQVHHDYKYLVWTPNTESNPRKFKWHKKGGGYQGLNSTEI